MGDIQIVEIRSYVKKISIISRGTGSKKYPFPRKTQKYGPSLDKKMLTDHSSEIKNTEISINDENRIKYPQMTKYALKTKKVQISTNYQKGSNIHK